MKSANVIRLNQAAKILGSDMDLVAEVVTITPGQATSWLQCNRHNRPVRRRHVEFLANEILAGNWQVNGQAIIIADDEQVLDGQHRLMAIIEAGKAIQSMVVYGITAAAFRTIDTGAVRNSSDALILHFPDVSHGTLRACATAVNWCTTLERGFIRTGGKISNTDAIEYVKDHPSLLQCADTIGGYSKDGRPLSHGCGAALYEMFGRKDWEQASNFIRRLFLGEELVRTDVEYVLRTAFQKDAQRIQKLPLHIRMRMVIKGWNWTRRGMTEASHQTIAIQANEEQKVVIF